MCLRILAGCDRRTCTYRHIIIITIITPASGTFTTDREREKLSRVVSYGVFSLHSLDQQTTGPSAVWTILGFNETFCCVSEWSFGYQDQSPCEHYIVFIIVIHVILAMYVILNYLVCTVQFDVHMYMPSFISFLPTLYACMHAHVPNCNAGEKVIGTSELWCSTGYYYVYALTGCSLPVVL